VVARGRGELAARIVALAREHGVPVRQDSDLAEALSALDVGREVPPALWQAVAEVLAFIYTANAAFPEERRPATPR
jgi:flagellar biosynthesis protein